MALSGTARRITVVIPPEDAPVVYRAKIDAFTHGLSFKDWVLQAVREKAARIGQVGQTGQSTKATRQPDASA